jgi:hypothetical protein
VSSYACAVHPPYGLQGGSPYSFVVIGPLYHGRLDAYPVTPAANARRDLFEAMKQVAETGHGPREQ